MELEILVIARVGLDRDCLGGSVCSRFLSLPSNPLSLPSLSMSDVVAGVAKALKARQLNAHGFFVQK